MFQRAVAIGLIFVSCHAYQVSTGRKLQMALNDISSGTKTLQSKELKSRRPKNIQVSFLHDMYG
jgi:hypothetical protein